MKRTIITAVSVLLAMSMLSGCGKKTSEQTTETTTQQSVSETTQQTTQTSESVTESSAPSETVSDTSSTSSETVETANPLTELANAALAVGEWPAMAEVTDENILADYFLLDKNDPNYKNIIVMQCPMSANMSELIIIEADDTAAAADALKERRKKAQDTDAFYPADQEKAKNAIVGTSGNYAYYILSSEPEKSEEAILMSIE